MKGISKAACLYFWRQNHFENELIFNSMKFTVGIFRWYADV